MEFPPAPVGTMSEFRLFGRLPPELRQEIWRFAIESPRIIHVQKHQKNGQSTCAEYNGKMCTQVSNIFHVNRESRDIALHYPFIQFGTIPRGHSGPETNYLITPSDIVFIGRGYPRVARDAVKCTGDSHLVQNLMFNCNAKEINDEKLLFLW